MSVDQMTLASDGTGVGDGPVDGGVVGVADGADDGKGWGERGR
jgi:hypothetical protein